MKRFVALVAMSLCSMGAYAQNAQPYYAAEATQADRVESAIAQYHWNELPGEIPVLYSKGYKDRAKAIQAMIEQGAEFYATQFPAVKFDLKAMVLSQSDWQKIHLQDAGAVYGMPDAMPEIDKLFIGADKKAVGRLFGETDTTPDAQLSRFDVIALHELGHIFLQRYHHTYTGKLWADEFLASYFAICFLQEHKNYPSLPQVGETGYDPPHTSLADFERLYSEVGARNYGWYQGRFQDLGYALYPKYKTRLLSIFIANDAPNGKKLSPLTLLKQLDPEVISGWEATLGDKGSRKPIQATP